MRKSTKLASGSGSVNKKIAASNPPIKRIALRKGKTINDYMIEIIQIYLDQEKNILTVAKMLKIGKSTLYRLIEKGDLEFPPK